MNSDNTCVLCKIAILSPRPAAVHFEGLTSKDLPEWDSKSCYAMDLALIFSSFIDFESFRIKKPRFKENAVWTRLSAGLTFGMALMYITIESRVPQVLSDANADHVRIQLDSRLKGFSELVGPHENQISVFSARSYRLMKEAVEASGLRLGNDNSVLGMTEILFNTMGAKFAVEKYLSSMANYLGVNESLDITDMFSPLRSGPSSTKTRNVEAALPPLQTVEQDSIPRFTGSAYKEYDGWVEYCLLIARMQRLPERLAVDLIPPKEVANHLLHDLDQWEAEFEKGMPGRRQWLVDEGVSRADFDKFWGSPAWVQNFIEKLVKRQWQLEFQGYIKMGNPEETAAGHAFLFIPTYTVWPSRPGAEHQDLPFELFERVRLHMALVDDVKFQEEMIANKLYEANAYIRMKIKTHQL